MLDYRPPKDLLAGRIILVTGAGDGIGRAAAISFAAHGATLVLLGRTMKKLEQTYDAIEEAGGPQPAILPLSLETATPQSYHELAATLETEFGRLDGLLHNAAEFPYFSRIEDYDPETWNRVLQVNLNAPFLLTQACLPLLRRSTDASLIFTSVQSAHRGKVFMGAYGVSKFALDGLMQILAAETDATQLRVNSIAPCPTRTSLRAQVYPGEDADTLPTPESLMPTYLYLMGPDSRGIRGRIFEIGPPALA